jgi:nicotinate phosphoribosyltransferase
MGAIYKMVEIETNDIKRYTAKRSLGKNSLAGTKQIFRFPGRDVVGRSSECMEGGRALQKPVILGGVLIQPLPDLNQSRERAAAALAELPAAIRQIETTEPYPVEYSTQLKQLNQSL